MSLARVIRDTSSTYRTRAVVEATDRVVEHPWKRRRRRRESHRLREANSQYGNTVPGNPTVLNAETDAKRTRWGGGVSFMRDGRAVSRNRPRQGSVIEHRDVAISQSRESRWFRGPRVAITSASINATLNVTRRSNFWQPFAAALQP